MDIEVRRWGVNKGLYTLVFTFGNTKVEEDFLEQDDVDHLTTELVRETLLAEECRYELIDKLLSVNILDEEMIKSWVKDNLDY